MSVSHLTWNWNLSPMGTLEWGCPPQQQIFLTKFWHLVRQDTKTRMERRENNPLPRASKCSEVLPWLTPVGMFTEVFRTIDTGPKLPLFLIHQQPECAFVLLFSFSAHIDMKGKFPSSPLPFPLYQQLEGFYFESWLGDQEEEQAEEFIYKPVLNPQCSQRLVYQEWILFIDLEERLLGFSVRI